VNGVSIATSGTEQAPDYSSFEEAEAAFMKLLRRYNVQPEWSWEQTMRATIKDPHYRALKDPKDRKTAFEKYAVEVRQQEKERAKERLAKLRTDFGIMLRSHPEIKHYSRWRTIRTIIERETIFRSTDDEEERKQLFEEYIVELKKANIENEAVTRKSAMTELAAILHALDLEPYTRWSEAQGVIQANERIQSDDKFKTLSKSDILTAFENHIKSLERTFNDARQQHKASKARRERHNRDQFQQCLQELRANGKIKAGSKWMAVLPEIEADPRYVAMLGQSGSTPLDLFWDMVEEEERALRGRRNDVYDVLEVGIFNHLMLLTCYLTRCRTNAMRSHRRQPSTTSSILCLLIVAQPLLIRMLFDSSSIDFTKRFSNAAKMRSMPQTAINVVRSMLFGHVSST
jgi:pre-mRNA-processing factor 40